MTNSTIHLASQLLAKNDPIMERLAKQYGPCEISPHSRHYEELVHSIISQQLSVKASATIWRRFLDLFSGNMPSPTQILATDLQSIRGVGLSSQKASYILDLARHIESGELRINQLTNLENQEVIRELTAVRGIGVWSAHMFLIFSLGRPDVLAYGDLGVRKSAQKLYGLPDLPDQVALERLAKSRGWRGTESIACWYLWKALDNKP